MHEITLTKKMRLGSNLLRIALYSRKSAVGIGLTKPKTAVTMLSCKRCIGNVRAKTKIGKMLIIQQEALTIEHGRVHKGCNSCTNKPESWTKEVRAMNIERKLMIRYEKKRVPTTKNETLMDEAVSNVKTKGLNKETID